MLKAERWGWERRRCRIMVKGRGAPGLKTGFKCGEEQLDTQCWSQDSHLSVFSRSFPLWKQWVTDVSQATEEEEKEEDCVALTLPAWFGVLSVCNLSSSVRFPICRLKQSEISEACCLLSEWNLMVQGWSATLFTTLHRNRCSMSSMKLWNYSLFEEHRCCLCCGNQKMHFLSTVSMNRLQVSLHWM